MLPEPGHILPTLRLAKNLESHGHRLSYVSFGPVERFLKRHSLNCMRILPTIFPDEPGEFLPALTFRERVFDYVAAKRRTLAEVLASELLPLSFDVLLCDSKIVDRCGPALREALGRELISIQPDLPDATAPTRASIRKVILCPKEIHMPSERVCSDGNSTLYAEPSVFRSRVAQSACPSPLRPCLIYCSFGTQSLRYNESIRVFKIVIQAFASTSFHLFIAAHHDCEALRSDALPANVEVVQSAPQLEILAHAQLFITHGGLGGIKEAIMAGVPCLVIPFDTDQPRNAVRLQYHQLGKYCLPSQCTPERIKRLGIDIIEDTNVALAVGRMKDIFWKYELLAPAANFILQNTMAKE